MLFPDIVTERLRLVTLTAEIMRADAAQDRSTLSTLLNADVPASWPPEHWEPHVFDFIEKQRTEYPKTFGWNRYALLRAEQPILIGTLGAFPKPNAEAEIGYSILPTWQRRGLATEATLALIAELFRDGALNSISAQTFPYLTQSLRVTEKCGMQFVGPGEEEGAVRYRLPRNRWGQISGAFSGGAAAKVDGENHALENR